MPFVRNAIRSSTYPLRITRWAGCRFVVVDQSQNQRAIASTIQTCVWLDGNEQGFFLSLVIQCQSANYTNHVT